MFWRFFCSHLLQENQPTSSPLSPTHRYERKRIFSDWRFSVISEKFEFSVKNLLNDLVKNRCDDNVQVLAKSLISLTIWCFNSLHQIILQVNEQPEMWNHQNQNVVLILNILNLICKENKTNCLLYIGRDILSCKLFIN